MDAPDVEVEIEDNKYLETIRRIESDDPYTHELTLDDILAEKHTVALLAEALRGNTNLRRLNLHEYGYHRHHRHRHLHEHSLDDLNLDMILDALSETNVSKITVVPYYSHVHRSNLNIPLDETYAMVVGKHLSSLPSLRKLDLNQCRIGPTAAITLSDMLANNSTLRHLNLKENEIGDEGAVAMGLMIQKNRTLEEVVLDDNEITPHGQRALRNAIFDDSSFGAMERSNHVLQSYFYNPRSVFGKGVLNDVLSSHAANLRSKSAKTASTKKLKRVLKKKYGVNLHFESFLGTEADLMPHVLGWIAGKCDLDMMYEFKPVLLNLFRK